jgi:hypothetical protein
MAIWPLCPGLAYQFNKSYNVAQGWIHLYQFGWLFAVTTSAFVYTLLSYAFKNPAMFEAQKNPWESLAETQREMLDKESEIETIYGETSSQDSQQDVEKDLGKSPGTVTVT